MTLPKMEAALGSRASTRVEPLVGPSAEGSASEIEPSMVRRADAFKLLGGVAEKALAMGRADEAERLLACPLADVVEASRAGRKLSRGLVDRRRGSPRSSRPRRQGGVGRLRHRAVRTRRGAPAPAPVVDELYIAIRKVATVESIRLRGYLAQLREKQASFGPAERFLLQRIEGLERLAALR